MTTFGDFNEVWKRKLAERAAEEALGPPPSTMTLAQITVELQSYKPLTAADVRRDPIFLARRAELWRRLDYLRASNLKFTSA
jgi:hypothetical protein